MTTQAAVLLLSLSFAATAAEPSVDFLHISDSHLADLAGVQPELAQSRARAALHAGILRKTLAGASGSSFVILSGDLVDAWCFDGASGQTIYGQVRQFQSVFDAATLPIYPALGNHDVECYRQKPDKPGPQADRTVAPEARRDWSKSFAAFRNGTYYSFRKPVGRTPYRFVVLDNGDVGRDQAFDDAQLAWVRKELASTESDAVVIVMHAPFDDKPFFTRLKAAIAANPRVVLALAGHVHVDRIRDIEVGGRTIVEALTPAMRAGPGNWRRIRLFEDRVELRAPGETNQVARTIPLAR